MALYKYAQDVASSNSDAFDKLYDPGITTPHSGIYKCNVCKYEVASIEGRPLPPPTDSNHGGWNCTPGSVRWRLAVYAVHKRS